MVGGALINGLMPCSRTGFLLSECASIKCVQLPGLSAEWSSSRRPSPEAELMWLPILDFQPLELWAK